MHYLMTKQYTLCVKTFHDTCHVLSFVMCLNPHFIKAFYINMLSLHSWPPEVVRPYCIGCMICHSLLFFLLYCLNNAVEFIVHTLAVSAVRSDASCHQNTHYMHVSHFLIISIKCNFVEIWFHILPENLRLYITYSRDGSKIF